MLRRYNRINEVCVELTEEAFRAYSGKRDYKRAIQIYCLLSESLCVPKDIAKYSKNMMARLGKQIQDKS